MVYAQYAAAGFVWSTPHFETNGRYLMLIERSGNRAILFEADNAVVTRYGVETLEAVQYVEGCS